MNPAAALKTNLADLKRGGTLIVNEDAFDRSNLSRQATRPIARGQFFAGRFLMDARSMTRLTERSGTGAFAARRTVAETSSRWVSVTGYEARSGDCAVGEGQVRQRTRRWRQANIRALNGGCNYGLDQVSSPSITVPPWLAQENIAKSPATRRPTLAVIAFGTRVIYSGYRPPTGDILHELSSASISES